MNEIFIRGQVWLFLGYIQDKMICRECQIIEITNNTPSVIRFRGTNENVIGEFYEGCFDKLIWEPIAEVAQ
jgi:hypothetical protein